MLGLAFFSLLLFIIFLLGYKLIGVKRCMAEQRGLNIEKEEEIQLLRLAQANLIDRFVKRTARLEQSNVEIKSAYVNLEKTRRELVLFFDIAPDMFCLADKNGRFHMVNPAFCKLLGYSREEMLERQILSFVHPDDRLSTWDTLNKACQGHVIKDSENRYIAKDGSIKILSWSARSADGSSLTYAAARDITGKAKALEKLKEHQALLDAILASSPVGICLVRGNKLVWANEAMQEIVGHSENALRCDLTVLYGNRDSYDADMASAFSLLRSQKNVSMDTTILREDGTTVEVLLQGRSLELHNPDDGIIFTITDITKRKQDERDLKQYQHRLSVLLRERARTEERQRRSLAADLHDGIGQDLALMRIRLQLLSSRLQRKFSPDIQQLTRQLDRIFKATRDMTIQLSPPVLTQLGLDAAVDWLLNQVKHEDGLMIESLRQGEVRQPDDEISTLMFRSVREILINIKKHANAECLFIVLKYSIDGVEFCITDDGVGFDPKKIDASPGHGFGLFSIKERLGSIGGELQIESGPEYGTTLVLRAPLLAPHY